MEMKPPKRWRLSGLPLYGLVSANIYLVVIIPVCGMQSWAWLGPVGLPVRVLRPDAHLQSSLGIRPVLVRIESAGPKALPRLYVNSVLIAREDFARVLQKELSRRPPNWPVYVEGSGDMEWGSAVKAIDVIKGLRAEVVLLTTKRAAR